MNKVKIKTNLLLAMALLSISNLAFAQGSGDLGLTEATKQITGYIGGITTLAMAIGGVVGVIGAIRIYQKWNSGDQDVQKELMGWGGACIFLIVAPAVVKAFFGL